MLKSLRRWHWNLLHRTFGLPDHDHAEPQTPLSAALRSHPPVPAHHRRGSHGHTPDLQSQIEREWQREPRVLKGWQLIIRAFVERRMARGSAQEDN